MNTELINTLMQSSGAATVSGLFVWYLYKRDKLNSQIYDRFDKLVENHLKRGQMVQRESNRVNQELAIKMQRLTDVINSLGKNVDMNTKSRGGETP